MQFQCGNSNERKKNVFSLCLDLYVHSNIHKDSKPRVTVGVAINEETHYVNKVFKATESTSAPKANYLCHNSP